MYLLRIVFALGLVFSLTLPLSTCGGGVEEGNHRQVERTKRYIVSEDSSISEWLWAVTFVLPFGITVAIRKRKTSIKLESICLLSVLPSGFVLWAHGATGKLASGGYLALMSIICFVIVSAICLTKVITGKIKAPASPPL